jgi:chemotaxis protein methyltransferase CheR
MALPKPGAGRAGLAAEREGRGVEPEIGPPGPGHRLAGLHLCLAAGGREALVSTAHVVEIADGLAVEKAPAAPDHIAGAFPHRGRRLLALDLASLLGAAPGPGAGGRVVVFSVGGGFGLRVEQAELARCSPLLVPGRAGTPEPGRRRPGVMARCGETPLPLLDADDLARLVGRPVSRVAAWSPRQSEADGADELAAVEAPLLERGLSLCPRLRRRLQLHLAATVAELGPQAHPVLPRILGGDPSAISQLLETAIAGETWFFRDAEQLAALRRLLIDAAERCRAMRIWSAGCGSGEEPYSVAMSLAAAGRAGTVLATDVDERALAHASAGSYGRWSFRRPHPDLGRFLSAAPPRAEVLPEIRQRVRFRVHDVRDEPLEDQFDAVLCRNVLGLLPFEDAYPALQSVVRAVRPGGYLLLGATETSLAKTLALERVVTDGAVLLRRPWAPQSAHPDESEGAPDPG